MARYMPLTRGEMDDSLIAYLCVALEHQTPPKERPGSPLTMHEERWAYCPAGAASEHLWRKIKPMNLAALRRWRHDEKK
jgi:hypothetical protein